MYSGKFVESITPALICSNLPFPVQHKHLTLRGLIAIFSWE